MENPTVWQQHPKAEFFLQKIVDYCLQKSAFLTTLKEDLKKHTSTNLFDWIDHVLVCHSQAVEDELNELGFISEGASPTYRVFTHPAAVLPKVIVKDSDNNSLGIAIKVESISDFLMVRGISGWIEGSPLSSYRRALVTEENEVSFWVVERRNSQTLEPTYEDPDYVEKYIEALEKWKCRKRTGLDDEKLMDDTLLLAQELVSKLGENLAACIVLEGERSYWQVRNLAGQVQKNRQDRLGMGWANHDHHTFRSSRKLFPKLVRLFEMLGFHARERFYAGKEAGWGAQVMENSDCGFSLFLDLDLAPEEIETDFIHQDIGKLDQLGTIGLWCQLHGDSILKAGMHHLAGKFIFEDLTQDLLHYNITMMEPFSDFSYLKQAFTHGEVYSVDPTRINTLFEEGHISREERDQF